MSRSSSPFVLPSIWANDDAMYGLMQPIRRPKHIDPEKYSEKVEFWYHLILEYVQSQRILVTTQKALKTAFSRYFPEEGVKMSPQCLCEVFEEYRKDGLVCAYTPKIGISKVASTLANYLLLKPITWTFNYAFGYTSTDDCKNQDENDLFVFGTVAHKTAEAFLQWFNIQYCGERLTDKFGSVYETESYNAALNTYLSHEPSREYIHNLLTSAYRCVSIQRVSSTDKTCTADVVRVSNRLACPAVSSSTLSTETESAILAGLAQLRTTVKRLEQDEQRLSMAIGEHKEQLKRLVAQKRMTEAKRLLRRTKLMTQALDKKQAQLHNLESMQLQLDSASDNQAVLRTLSDSSRVIRQTVDGMGGLASVEETLHSISDSLQDTNEISDIITSMAQTSIIDEDDLKRELESLVDPTQQPMKPPARLATESSRPEDEGGIINLLPDVPSTPISTAYKVNAPLSLYDQTDN